MGVEPTTAATGPRRRVIDEFEGLLTAEWFGDDIVIEIGGADIDEYLVELKDQRVRVTVEVLP